MTDPKLANLATWLTRPLDSDVAASIERIRRAADVEHVAVMPDVHLAHDVCVGAVVATREVIYPAAVGSDIGCGMATVAINASADWLDDERRAGQLLAGLYAAVPSNRHRTRLKLPARLADVPLSHPRLAKAADRDGRVQFGTLGRGNHFLEFQCDQADQLWVLVHSGSRALGQLITRHHLANCDDGTAGLPGLRAGTDNGRNFLADVAWARAYAEESRLTMLRAVESLVGRLFGVAVDWDSLIHNDHNHVQHELHFGQSWWIHRKGAQAANENAPAIVPGSMGTPSFHVAGRGIEPALRSCSHGAGRALSRRDTRQKVDVRSFCRQMGCVWFDHRRVAALREEAPAAYKDIRQVMRAQKDLVRMVRELRPILSYKGV